MTTVDTRVYVRLNGLLSGDRFIARGDAQRRVHGPVNWLQDWGNEFVTVYFEDGTSYDPGRHTHGFELVELVHRESDCEHGVHPDLCETACWAF